jgi:hypothetical protein
MPLRSGKKNGAGPAAVLSAERSSDQITGMIGCKPEAVLSFNARRAVQATETPWPAILAFEQNGGGEDE